MKSNLKFNLLVLEDGKNKEGESNRQRNVISQGCTFRGRNGTNQTKVSQVGNSVRYAGFSSLVIKFREIYNFYSSYNFAELYICSFVVLYICSLSIV